MRRGADIPLCKMCTRIALETAVESPQSVVALLYRLAHTVGEYLRWTHEDTPMGKTQLSNLHTRARHLLNTTYPLTLTKDGRQLSSFQDHLTDAFKIWMRECARNNHNDMTLMFAEIMNTFFPSECNFAVSVLEKMPTGYIVIEAGLIEKVLGVKAPDVGSHDRVAIELPNLFAMVDPEYAGRLACTLKEDPHGSNTRSAE